MIQPLGVAEFGRKAANHLLCLDVTGPTFVIYKKLDDLGVLIIMNSKGVLTFLTLTHSLYRPLSNSCDMFVQS